jgi:hypothetical protein
MLEIATFFLCLLGYRAVCQAMNWHPAPLVQITFHNHRSCDDA